MSISSVGASGAGNVSQLLAKMLSRLDQPPEQETKTLPFDGAQASSKKGDCKTPSMGKPTLSDAIVGLMVGLQAQDSAPTQDTAAADPVQQTFAALDTDGDEEISQSELETYVQKLGGTKDEADKLYAALAGDDDGVTKDAFATAAAAGRPHGPHGGGGKVEDKTFDALDTNQDGTVSGEELAAAFSNSESNAASSLFSAIDSNGDKSVTADEFSSFLNSFRQMATRSYTATENLLMTPPSAAQSTEA